jgi:hypothetical protein
VVGHGEIVESIAEEEVELPAGRQVVTIGRIERNRFAVPFLAPPDSAVACLLPSTPT